MINKLNKQNIRISWVDYAKGIGIFLVVLGHLLRSFIQSEIVENNLIFIFIDDWIYAFHMPLFFLLSGLFIHQSLNKSFSYFVIQRLKVLAYPYFLWSILQGILQVIFSHYTNNQITLSELGKIFYIPTMQFWFLYVLFMINLFYGLIYIKFREKTTLLFITISLFFYVTNILNINLHLWSMFNRIVLYLIYFIIGILIGSKNYIISKNLNRYNFLILSIFSFFILTIGVNLKWTQQLKINPLFAIVGCFGVIFISIFLSHINQLNFIKIWGLYSLEIFLAHTIFSAFVRIILSKLLNINDFYLHFIIGILAGIYLPIILALLLNKFNIKYVFRFP